MGTAITPGAAAAFFQIQSIFSSMANGSHGSHIGTMSQWDGSVRKLINCTGNAMGGDTGHFGLLEVHRRAIEVFAALMHTAEEWLVARDTRHISGPFNLSINQECGVLVEGFRYPPMVMMPHSRRWYATLTGRAGYRSVEGYACLLGER